MTAHDDGDPGPGPRVSRGVLPGWLKGTLLGVVGVSVVGLPITLVVAGLDLARREGSAFDRGVVLGGLVVAAIVLVVALERGLVYGVRSGWSLWSVVGVVAGVALTVLVGVLVPPLGLVLVAIGVVLATVLVPVGLGVLAWWRWRTGPTVASRAALDTDDVRARAEERRTGVRTRHRQTTAAVAAGYIGPGFTRGRR